MSCSGAFIDVAKSGKSFACMNDGRILDDCQSIIFVMVVGHRQKHICFVYARPDGVELERLAV